MSFWRLPVDREEKVDKLNNTRELLRSKKPRRPANPLPAKAESRPTQSPKKTSTRGRRLKFNRPTKRGTVE